MEEKQLGKPSRLLVNNRNTVSLTGVNDVISFNISEILLETEEGMLDIKGHDLHVNRLNLEKGEVDIDGRFDAFVYSEISSYGKKGESIVKRLFK
jgi:sporulation protein YabP